MDMQKPETPEPRNDAEVHSETMKSSRRAFLAKCMLISGTALVYLTPSVKAHAGTGAALSHPGPVFDITLPATYNVGGAPFVLTFAIPGSPVGPLDADFTPAGQVRLLATATPGVASVQSNGLTITSVGANPLLPAGENCGQIAGTIPVGRVLGSLNLDTGVFTPGDFQMDIGGTTCGPQPNAPVHGGGGIVLHQGHTASSSNCLNNNTVTLSGALFSSGAGTVTGVYKATNTGTVSP